MPAALWMPDPVAKPFCKPLSDNSTFEGADAILGAVLTLPARATPSHQPWTSGHPLAVHGDDLWLVDRDNGVVVRMDRHTLVVRDKVAVGARPEQVVVAPDGSVFVTVRGEGKVVRLPADGSTQGKLEWTVGTGPIGLALAPDAAVLYVVVAGERRVVALDAMTGKVLASAPTAADPYAVIATPQLVVVTHQAGPSFVFGRAALDSGGLAPASPQALGRATLGRVCGAAETTARHATRAIAGAYDAETGEVRVVHTVVSPGSAEQVIQAAVCPAPKAKKTASGDGGNAYGAPPTESGDGGKHGCMGGPRRPVEPAISRISAAGTGLAQPEKTVVFGESKAHASNVALADLIDQPADLALHPGRRIALLAATGTDNVMVLRLGAPGEADLPVALVPVGQTPRGVALSGDGLRAYVLCGGDFTVRVLSLAGMNESGKSAQSIALVAQAKFGEDPLSPLARSGRLTFHFAGNPRLSAGGRFACATCHLDGGEDKQVWFIGDGPRQTPALAGRLHDSGPFNWLGSEGMLRDNMTDTVHRMGGQGLEPGELEALEAFLIEGLQAPPRPVADELTPAQANGKALFFDAKVACAGCHVPGTGTDGELHDVGTAAPADLKIAALRAQQAGVPTPKVRFNTPSLRSLHATAPYLHDGSAATLADVLARTATTMGHTAHLSEGQRADLVAYLLTL